MFEKRISNALRGGIERNLDAGKGKFCNLYASPARNIEVTNKGQCGRHSM